MINLVKSKLKSLRCDWLEVRVSFKFYKSLVYDYVALGFTKSTWLDNFQPSVLEVDRVWAYRVAAREAESNGDYFGRQRIIQKAQDISAQQVIALKEGWISEAYEKWYLCGYRKNHILLFKESKKKGFVHITASGPAGQALLIELRKYTKEYWSDNLQFIRLDLKKQMPFSSSHRTLNWDRIYKRQLEAEAKKSRYRRKVELIKSETGTTLAIGTRGGKTYCRLEYINASNKLNPSNEPLISFELEYRKEQAEKIGYILLKNDISYYSDIFDWHAIEADEKSYKNLLKDYLLTLEPIH